MSAGRIATKVVTIDGPVASGKSSVSRELARRLGWDWVSTGAFYRGLAFVAFSESCDLTDAPSLVALVNSDIWEVKLTLEQTKILWRGQDVTTEAMAEANGLRASAISQLPEVRQALLLPQRDCAVGREGLVAEGRDCGTVVFPSALLKIYLTASSEARAERRAREQGLNLKATQDQQLQRDKQDSSRSAAPLAIPDGARVVDSNGMNLTEVVDLVESWVRAAIRPNGPSA